MDDDDDVKTEYSSSGLEEIYKKPWGYVPPTKEKGFIDQLKEKIGGEDNKDLVPNVLKGLAALTATGLLGEGVRRSRKKKPRVEVVAVAEKEDRLAKNETLGAQGADRGSEMPSHRFERPLLTWTKVSQHFQVRCARREESTYRNRKKNDNEKKKIRGGVGSGHRIRKECDKLHYVECRSSVSIASEDSREQCH